MVVVVLRGKMMAGTVFLSSTTDGLGEILLVSLVPVHRVFCRCCSTND